MWIKDDTVKPVLMGHQHENQNLVFKIDNRLSKCRSKTLQNARAFCNVFDLHLATVCFKDHFVWILHA